MTDLESVGALVVRATNAVVWTAFLVRLMRSGVAITPLARRVICAVLVIGLWLLVIGALVSIGLVPGWIARNLYTAFTGVALVAGFALLTTDEGRAA